MEDVVRGLVSSTVVGLESALSLQPGRITELAGPAGSGMTRLGLQLLAEPSRRSQVVALDVKGWLSPTAAWEVGVDPTRLVVVRCREPGIWVQLMAVLMEGARALYAEVPSGISDHDLRRLAALARARKVGVAMRSLGEQLPSGTAFIRLNAVGVSWEGTDDGHGSLGRRQLRLDVSGKGVAGMTRSIEVIDDGADGVRVVSRLASHMPEDGRAAV